MCPTSFRRAISHGSSCGMGCANGMVAFNMMSTTVQTAATFVVCTILTVVGSLDHCILHAQHFGAFFHYRKLIVSRRKSLSQGCPKYPTMMTCALWCATVDELAPTYYEQPWDNVYFLKTGGMVPLFVWKSSNQA